MKLLPAKAQQQLEELHHEDEQGNVHLTIPSKVKGVAKYGAIGIVTLAALHFILPGILAVAASFLLYGTIVTVGGASILFWRNKDIQRGVRFWLKANGKKVAEKYLGISPMDMAKIIIDNKKIKFKNIEGSIVKLEGTKQTVEDTIKRNEIKIEQKILLLTEARRSGKVEIAEQISIEINELYETNEFFKTNASTTAHTLHRLYDVKEASKYKLERDQFQFDQMVSRRDIIITTHTALSEANSIINVDDDTKELDKALEEIHNEVSRKISQITLYSNATDPYIERVKMEKRVAGQLALKRLDERLLALPSNGEIINANTGEVLDESKEIS